MKERSVSTSIGKKRSARYLEEGRAANPFDTSLEAAYGDSGRKSHVGGPGYVQGRFSGAELPDDRP